jgi:hypothetical protein
MGTSTHQLELEISGKLLKFTVSQLPAMRAFKLLDRILRAFGPSIGSIAGASSGALAGGVSLAKLNVAALGEGIAVLFERLTEDELESVTRGLLAGAMVVIERGGKRSNVEVLEVFDELFAGHIFSVLKLLRFAFEANYGDFFDAVRGFAVRAKAGGEAGGSRELGISTSDSGGSS